MAGLSSKDRLLILYCPPYSDPTNSALVSTAQAGIKQAESSIGNIALSIITGQQASADDRDGVLTGLTAVQTSLGNITSYVSICRMLLS